MSQQKRVPKKQAHHKKQVSLKPVASPAQFGGQSEFNNLFGMEDSATIQTQADRLGDPRLKSAQKQALAAQIGRVQGNKHLQRVMGSLPDNRPNFTTEQQTETGPIQRHSIASAPPPVTEEEEAVQTKSLVQRHSIASAPPPVTEEEEEVQTKSLVQRTAETRQTAFGKLGVAGTENGRTKWMSEGKANTIQRWKIGGKSWGVSVDSKGVSIKGGGYEAKLGPSGFKFGPTPVKFGKVTFAPKEIPADGTTTSKASVTTTPGGRALTWGFFGLTYGSTIDASGTITPGTKTMGLEKVPLIVKAADAKVPTSYTFGLLYLYDAKFYQAKKDYETFIKSSPYKFPTFRPNNWSFSGGKFTAYNWGRFDVEYDPKGKSMDINVKVRFAFIDDLPKAGESKRAKKRREERHKKYREGFASQVKAGWSAKFDFKNIREPQSVWGKLNPVKVQVKVQDVEQMKKVGGAVPKEHWLIKIRLKSSGTAEVIDRKSLVKFYRGDDKPSRAFNPDARRGELKRLRRVTPSPILFGAGSAAIDPKYKPNLQFMADYLKRINNPQFELRISGHTNSRGKSSDNRKLSEKRAQAVEAALKGGGVTNHTLSTRARGESGASRSSRWDKVTIRPRMAKSGWRNVQDVTLHEFGHMIGLDDEYTRSGDTRSLAEHYMLIKKAFGDKYAKEVSKIPDADSASVMYEGNDIRIQHYVTIWQALYETTLQKAPVPTKRFDHKDWKFNE